MTGKSTAPEGNPVTPTAGTSTRTVDGGATTVEDEVVRTALADVDALGGFFGLSTRPAEGADPSWRPLTELTRPPGADDPLGTRIDQVATQLGRAERRVAASLLSLSLCARFTAVLLGAAVEHQLLPLLPHDRLHWRPWPGGPMPLWIDRPRGRILGAPDDPATADALAAELAEVHLRPLLEAFRARASVSPTVLWGNASSSLGGGLRTLATERPHTLGPATELARAVVARPPLDGLGRFVAEPGHPTGLGFARRTCCLYHRMPGGGVCGDCILRHPDAA